MKIRLEIECGNAAFGDQADERAAEIARILRVLAERVERLGPPGFLDRYSDAFHHGSYRAQDANGNHVAELWRVHRHEGGFR